MLVGLVIVSTLWIIERGGEKELGWGWGWGDRRSWTPPPLRSRSGLDQMIKL